jgi:hypothetical protein
MLWLIHHKSTIWEKEKKTQIRKLTNENPFDENIEKRNRALGEGWGKIREGNGVWIGSENVLCMYQNVTTEPIIFYN